MAIYTDDPAKLAEFYVEVFAAPNRSYAELAASKVMKPQPVAQAVAAA
jgi:hypothetical protein